MSLEFSKATDTEHKITLDSTLVYAAWRTGLARVGRKVQFEVMTSFVGNGAKIKITGKSKNRKKLGKINGKIKNNKFVGEFDIPENIKLDDYVYFKVELSQLGLSDESNRIPVAPAINVTNMRWSADEARRGDILTLSADVSGCRDRTEAKVTIYEYDADGAHDKIVELPATVQEDKIELQWEYEYHEDTDEIPSREEVERYGGSYNPPEYFFVIEISEEKFGLEQESGLLMFKDYVDIELKNQLGEPVPNEEYVIILPDGTEREGTLDENGSAIERDVPPGRCTIRFKNL